MQNLIEKLEKSKSKIVEKLIIQIFIAIICILPVAKLLAQEVRVDVQVELNALPEEKRQKLQNFQDILNNYFNNYQWTNDEIVSEISLKVQILLQDVSVSYEDRYKMQIIVSNNDDVQYTDKRCRMEYQKGEIPVHSENNWDSLTSLLDYFTYIVIGEEMDKFGHLLGTPYLEKAKMIADQARFGLGQFIEGWELRYQLIDYLLGDSYKKFREMKDFYFYGLYFADDDLPRARRYMKEAIRMLQEFKEEENPKYPRVETFLNSHFDEIVKVFRGSQDQEVYDILVSLDPDRKEIYDDLL